MLCCRQPGPHSALDFRFIYMQEAQNKDRRPQARFNIIIARHTALGFAALAPVVACGYRHSDPWRCNKEAQHGRRNGEALTKPTL